MGYVQDLENGLVDCCRNDHYDAKDVAMDVVMLSLRTAKGLDLKSFREAYGGSLVFLRGFLFSSSKEGILVILRPKTMSFWVFYPF